MPENGTLGLTWRELETESRDGLRHRQMAKAAGKRLLPGPTATAPALDPTDVEGTGNGVKGRTEAPARGESRRQTATPRTYGHRASLRPY